MIGLQKNNIKGSIILLCGAFIWGLAFVFQNGAAGKIGPLAFNSLRSLLGAFVVFLFLYIKNRPKKISVMNPNNCDKKTFWTGGILCGICLCVSMNLQQAGISAYPKGVSVEARSGFLTALYVIFVPILAVFLKKKISFIIWISVIIAFCGIYLLCLKDGISGIYLGDILMLLCSVSFSVHILAVDKYCNIIGGAQLSVLQFAVCGVLSGILSLIFEPETSLSNITAVIPQILYLGIMSSGVAYTLQIVGQKYAEPAVASISMSFESVFAALGGWVITGNGLSLREGLGCLLVFIAIITAQTPEFSKRKAVKE